MRVVTVKTEVNPKSPGCPQNRGEAPASPAGGGASCRLIRLLPTRSSRVTRWGQGSSRSWRACLHSLLGVGALGRPTETAYSPSLQPPPPRLSSLFGWTPGVLCQVGCTALTPSPPAAAAEREAKVQHRLPPSRVQVEGWEAGLRGQSPGSPLWRHRRGQRLKSTGLTSGPPSSACNQPALSPPRRGSVPSHPLPPGPGVFRRDGRGKGKFRTRNADCMAGPGQAEETREVPCHPEMWGAGHSVTANVRRAPSTDPPPVLSKGQAFQPLVPAAQ